MIDSINDPPEITSTEITVATEDDPYTYDVDATDPDGDILTYLLTTSPSGMSIDAPTGLITWTPTNDDVGDHSVVVTVNDGNGGDDTQSFTIAVANVNDPPEITSTADTTATTDTAYRYDVNATDPDVGDVLTYSLTVRPSGMSINLSTGVISWTPTNVGTYNVTVMVSDGNGGSDTQPFTVAVSVGDLPPPPPPPGE